MLKGKKFFALILSVLMLFLLGSSGAFALSISVSNNSHTISDTALNAIYIDANENFSITFTATDVQGTVRWEIDRWDSVPIGGEITQQKLSTVNFTSSGNTATVTGSLNEASYILGILITAVDLDKNEHMIDIQFYQGAYYNNAYYSQSTNGNSNGSNNGSTPVPVPNTGNNTQETTPVRLHVATVEPIPEEYKTDDLLQKLADNASISRSDIQWLSADVINTAEPPEPTTKMREQVKSDGYEFVAKLNTIKVSEDGYYAFMVTVSDDLVGTKVSDLKLYYAEPSDFLASTNGSVETAFGLMPLINGITGGLEVSNFLGVKLDTLPKQFLATMFLSASKSMTVYIVKILLALLGGCNVGFGVIGISAGGFLIWRLHKRHS